MNEDHEFRIGEKESLAGMLVFRNTILKSERLEL